MLINDNSVPLATKADLVANNRMLLQTPTGTKQLDSVTLKEVTAENALADNIAQAFDPTRTNANPYKAGENVIYNGSSFTFAETHYGAWDSSKVFANLMADGANTTLTFSGNGVNPLRSYFIRVSENSVYTISLSDINWSVTSLSDSMQKFSVTAIKKDGTKQELIACYKNSIIDAYEINAITPKDCVGVYLFFRGDVGTSVNVSVIARFYCSTNSIYTKMSGGSIGNYLNQNGLVTYNVIPTLGKKFIKIKIDAQLGLNETYVFGYCFFKVDSGIVPLNATGAVPDAQRTSKREILGNTTGEIEIEIPDGYIGIGFDLFKQLNGVSVSIQRPYFYNSISYYLYEIPLKIQNFYSEVSGSTYIYLESGTFSDTTPTIKVSNSSRIRNTNVVPVTKYFKLPLISGFLYWIFCFDENFNVLARIGWVKRADVKDLFPGTKYVNFSIKDNLQAARNISSDLSYLQNLINNDDTLDVSRFVSFEQKYNPVSHYNSSGWKSRFNLIHTTDNHIDPIIKQSVVKLKDTISLSNYISSNIDAVVDTGDVTNGYNIASSLLESEFADAKDAFVKSQKPVLVSLGNHDGNDNADPSQCLTPQQQWDWLYSALEGRFSDVHFGDKANLKAYSYLDVSRNGSTLRIIALDQLDAPSYTTKVLQHTAIYSQSQIDWLVNLLENTPANYGIVICNHFPFAPYRAGGYSEEWPCLNDGSFAQGWQMIPEIIQAFSSRSTLNKTYADANGFQDIEVDADFSSVPATSQFCFYMCGHTHSKNTFYVKQEGGVDYNQLMLVEDSSALLGVSLNKVWRDISSPISNAFSILSVDLVERCVYRTSFGAIQKFNEATAQRISKIPFVEN